MVHATIPPPPVYSWRCCKRFLCASASLFTLLLAPFKLGGAPLPEPYRETRMALHTLVEIKAYGDNVEGAVNAAFKEMERINLLLNNYDPQSEVSLVNSAAGLKEVPVSPETLEALLGAQFYGRLTGGALDITIGPLLTLWGFTREIPAPDGGPPSAHELEKTRWLVDYASLRLDAIKGTALLPRAGMWIDCGSFTKGYAADRAVLVLKKHGVTSALIAAGGTIVAMGKKPGGNPWQVGIRHPRQQGALLGSVPLEWQAVSTSGDYERFYLVNDRRISHIIDPRSGQPAEAVQCISVIAPTAAASDALSTALFVLGSEEGINLVNSLPDTEALIIDGEGIQHQSRGWPGMRH